MAFWALITGDKGDGKTSLALRVAARLRDAGLRVGGFVQRGVRAADGTRIGYDLIRLDGGESLRIARRGTVPQAGQEGFCSHVFDTGAFVLGLEWLRDGAARADVLFVDEVSRLEVAGQGHAEAVRWALALPAPALVVLCVRSEQLFAAVQRFIGDGGDEAVATIHALAAPEAEGEFASRLCRAVRGTSR